MPVVYNFPLSGDIQKSCIPTSMVDIEQILFIAGSLDVLLIVFLDLHLFLVFFCVVLEFVLELVVGLVGEDDGVEGGLGLYVAVLAAKHKI